MYKLLKMRLIMILLSLSLLQASCAGEHIHPEPEPESDFKQFKSATELINKFDELAALNDSVQRVGRINMLWDSLKWHKQIPFVKNDTAVFLYRGSGTAVNWAGDFNGWNPATAGWQGQKIGSTNIWRLIKQFPADARLDYKIVVNSNWILDPDNPLIQYSGFGPNSELRMPEWVFPAETRLAEGVQRGTLSEPFIIQSSTANLGYNVRYRVYTPHSYQTMSQLPVMYVTDGHEYADDRLGAMIIVLDNLIHQGKINPVIAVFIDPRDPVSGTNRRMSEYRANIRFANFVADELVAKIDTDFRTNTQAEARAILGTSLGGWNSAFFGFNRHDVFRLIGIHSPAFDNAIIQNFATSPLLPLKIYMSTGVINDTQNQARNMKAVLNEKTYPLMYKEVNQGHSWGNWRALIDEPLIYFFGK
jgi:enterochelin esterase-like enzyme